MKLSKLIIKTHLGMKKTNITEGTLAIVISEAAGNKPEEIDNKNLIEGFEITQPLKSYGVYDPDFSNYVSPVKKRNDDNIGVRTVILIDYQQTVVADVLFMFIFLPGSFSELRDA